MDEQDPSAVSTERSTGRVIMGALLAAAGSALLIERLGAMPPRWRASIWPVLLIGYGLARLLQPRTQGREGLFFVLAGSWWLTVTSGWMSLERTWPLLIVALGVSIMFQSATAGPAVGIGPHPLRGRRHGAAPWLLLAILLGAAVSSGLPRRGFARDASGEGVLHVYSVLGGSNTRTTTLTGGEIVSIMGGSVVDLRDATIAPGQTVTLDVFTVMGGSSIRVPDAWLVDFQVVPVLGSARDQRRLPESGRHDTMNEPGGSAEAIDQAPRLVVRGSVIMGGLVIKP